MNKILIHKGDYANILKLMPRVETSTLSSGWDDGKTAAFTNAIKQVVIENPILSSHLIWEKKALYACTGTYPPDKYEFVTVVEEKDIDIEHLDTHKARLDFINKHISSKVGFKKKLVSEDLKTKRPRFHAHLFRFRNGYACYHVGISHALVDGHTYYLIIDQISSFMNQQEISKIVWGNPNLATLETVPDHYTKRDKRRSGLLPLLFGFLRYQFRSGKHKEHAWLIISKEELVRQKDKQVDKKVTDYISSHDLIISSLSKLIQSSDEIVITFNNRERDSSFNVNDGGNCLKQMSMPSKIASNPNFCRKAVNKGYYYGANEYKGKALRQGRVCWTSTWATGHKSIQGVSMLCHCPSLEFVYSIPADTCIIFPIDNEYFGVSHNISKFNETELSNMEKWLKVVE